MSENERVDALREKLYREDGGALFAILDGASVAGLLQKLADHQPKNECLSPGELKPDMAEVSPYLVELDTTNPFTEWVLDRGWGKHWGVFVESTADLATLRRHLRSFLTVHDPSGKPMWFRFYDPRVLRTYLPTCNAEELTSFFGPVQSFSMEDETGAALWRFVLKNNALVKQTEKL